MFGNTFFLQTFIEFIKLIYTFWCIGIPDVTASYGRPFDFFLRIMGIFIHIWLAFISELNQTFTDCVSDSCTHFGMLTCQTAGYGRFANSIEFV